MAKLLIVDDDEALLRMYQTKFANGGYDVITAINGEDALQKMQVSIPDAILLDIMMPKMDGLEMLRVLKKDEKHKHIPVILLTNIGETEENIEEGLKLGAITYLVKSKYQPQEILLKVKEILSASLHKAWEDIPKVEVVVKSTDAN